MSKFLYNKTRDGEPAVFWTNKCGLLLPLMAEFKCVVYYIIWLLAFNANVFLVNSGDKISCLLCDTAIVTVKKFNAL